MRLILTLSMPFKSKLSPHGHRGGKGYAYACPLTLRMESCQSMTHQDNFVCSFVISKGELIEKVLPLGLEGVACKIIEEECRIMVFGIADMNFGLGDMNSYTPDAVFVHL